MSSQNSALIQVFQTGYNGVVVARVTRGHQQANVGVGELAGRTIDEILDDPREYGEAE